MIISPAYKIITWNISYIYMAAGEGEFKEFGWTIRAELGKGNIIQAEIFRSRKDIRIGFYSAN